MSKRNINKIIQPTYLNQMQKTSPRKKLFNTRQKNLKESLKKVNVTSSTRIDSQKATTLPQDTSREGIKSFRSSKRGSNLRKSTIN